MYTVLGPEGQVYGPVGFETLKAWCLDARINSDTRIIDPIDGVTKRVLDMPEVAQYIRPPAGPPAFRPSYARQGVARDHSVAQQYSYLVYGEEPPKNKLVAIVLAFFLGVLGIHRFYMGHVATGIAMLCITVLSFGALAFVTFIWSIIDIALIGTGALNDERNRPLVWH